MTDRFQKIPMISGCAKKVIGTNGEKERQFSQFVSKNEISQPKLSLEVHFNH